MRTKKEACVESRECEGCETRSSSRFQEKGPQRGLMGGLMASHGQPSGGTGDVWRGGDAIITWQDLAALARPGTVARTGAAIGPAGAKLGPLAHPCVLCMRPRPCARQAPGTAVSQLAASIRTSKLRSTSCPLLASRCLCGSPLDAWHCASLICAGYVCPTTQIPTSHSRPSPHPRPSFIGDARGCPPAALDFFCCLWIHVISCVPGHATVIQSLPHMPPLPLGTYPSFHHVDLATRTCYRY